MEEQIIYLVDGFKTPALDRLMSLVSESYPVAILLVVLYFLYRRNNNVYPLLLTLFLTLITATVLKMVITESRPCSELQISYLECDDPLESFPSRHAALASTPLMFLLAEMPLFIIYLAYLLLVGFTRVYLGVHYPHDVFAGMAVGILLGYACLKLKGPLNALIYKIAEKVKVRKYLP